MFEHMEEQDNLKNTFELHQSVFSKDLIKLKNIIDIVEKKKELGSLSGIKENLIKLAKSYIDTMLQKLAEKQTDNEMQKDHDIVTGLIYHMEHPNLPLPQEMIVAIADKQRSQIAESVGSLVQSIGSEPGIFGRAVKWLGERAGVAKNATVIPSDSALES